MTSLLSASAELLSKEDLSHTPYDALVAVVRSPVVENARGLGAVAAAGIEALTRADATFGRSARPPVLIPWPTAPGKRLVVAPLGPLTEDTDDARNIAEAASAAMTRAVEAGATNPLFVMHPFPDTRFVNTMELGSLAALASQWSPLEARESGKPRPTAGAITVVALGEERARRVEAIERGRILCRDIAGTEPERMTPRRIAAHCAEVFAGTGVTVSVTEDVSGYPLLAAVARASQKVERHRPSIVELRYCPNPGTGFTVILCGKGVTYDTGGADLKTDGSMAGMSRDKGGAAAVAGIVRAAAELKLQGVQVIGLLGLVRNSIGDDAYVSDEIIPSRAGVRVRIGNTDAEGRLVLADLLARAKELAPTNGTARIFSIATLTGHVYRAFGPYTGCIGNPAAKRCGDLDMLDQLSERCGEPMERSRPRREDYAFVAPKSPAEDVISSNRLATVATPRGHQFPFAFLDIASGLKNTRIPFIHLDIGGAAYSPADWQTGTPTAVPVLTLLSYLEELVPPTPLIP
ncbi:MAG: leucyl aminopeptidase family protein [Polyangiaceae bacterium]